MTAQKITIVEDKKTSEYTIDEIVTLAREAKTKSRLAIMLGVHRETILNTEKSNQEFAKAVLEGLRQATTPVIESLYKQANKGDTGAIKYILNNREGLEWADKTKVEQTVELKGNVLDKLDESYESND